jgi:pilus assembly protein Flp/PilA
MKSGSSPADTSINGGGGPDKRRKTDMDLFVLKTWLEAKFNANDETGASMVEYGLLLALIAVIAIVAVKALGSSVSTKFSSVNSSLNYRPSAICRSRSRCRATPAPAPRHLETPRKDAPPMSILLLFAWLQARLETTSERGAGMVEYGLLLALIAVVALVAVKAFGTGVSSQFSSISSSVN